MSQEIGKAIMWLRNQRSSFPKEKQPFIDRLCKMCNRNASLSELQRDSVRAAIMSIEGETAVAAFLSLATYINTCRDE